QAGRWARVQARLGLGTRDGPGGVDGRRVHHGVGTNLIRVERAGGQAGVGPAGDVRTRGQDRAPGGRCPLDTLNDVALLLEAGRDRVRVAPRQVDLALRVGRGGEAGRWQER